VKFIVHEEPALRADSNYIARIDLRPFGFDDEVEQVWLRRTADGVAVLCCIPFRAYGVALGDTVRISPDDYVTEVTARSGRRVLRALIVEPDPADAAAELEARIARTALRFESSGGRHVAIDVPEGVEPSDLLDFMDEREAEGNLLWEWADVEPFLHLTTSRRRRPRRWRW
jgi:hypothetical protein